MTAAQTHHHAPLGHEPQAERVAAGPETLMWCGRLWTVLGRTEREAWLRYGHLHQSVPHDLISGENLKEKTDA